jgi:hypothetical protein
MRYNAQFARIRMLTATRFAQRWAGGSSITSQSTIIHKLQERKLEYFPTELLTARQLAPIKGVLSTAGAYAIGVRGVGANRWKPCSRGEG